MNSKIIRVFPRRTNATPCDKNIYFTGPTLRPLPDKKVHVSVTFTWDRQKGLKLYKSWSKRFNDVRIGGPAFDDPGGEYIRDRLIRK